MVQWYPLFSGGNFWHRCLLAFSCAFFPFRRLRASNRDDLSMPNSSQELTLSKEEIISAEVQPLLLKV